VNVFVGRVLQERVRQRSLRSEQR